MSNSNNTSSDSEPDVEETRPNRWIGPPASWLSLTEEERGLAASLDTLRNADLGIHLFNAHALKRRAREAEAGRDIESEFPDIPPEDQTFRPANGWTAWPLPPEDVPRTGEQIGPKQPFEKYTFKAQEDGAPSRELEDILMGVTLRFAKQRFMDREEAPIEKIGGNRKARAILEEDLDATGSEFHDSSDQESVKEQAFKSAAGKEYLKPAVSADDERSRQLLLPSIRHTLSKLDDVLLALHHARKTCRRYSQSEAGTSDDESIAGNSSEQGQTSYSKRARRKFANLPNRSKSDAINEANAQDSVEQDDVRRSKSAGRPKRTYERLQGEAEHDYLVHVAPLQEKPLPLLALPAAKFPSKSPSRGRSRSQSVHNRRGTSEDLRSNKSKKLGVRDWSEVLGVAALVGGFDESVIKRAVKRCADLFGEGMVLRGMAEVPYGEKREDEVTKYVPELIPAFDPTTILSPSSEEDSDADFESKFESEQMLKPGFRTKSRISRQVVFCPIPACPRRVQGFRGVGAMKRHLERGHGIAKEKVGEWMVPSDEEMEGAVHRDGFLRQVKRAVVSRGKYKIPEKRARQRKKRGDVGERGDEENSEGEWEDDANAVDEKEPVWDGEGEGADEVSESSDSSSE